MVRSTKRYRPQRLPPFLDCCVMSGVEATRCVCLRYFSHLFFWDEFVFLLGMRRLLSQDIGTEAGRY